MKTPIKPKFPLHRFIYAWDIFDMCPKCGSSLNRKWLFFKDGRCIHPECINYHEKIIMKEFKVNISQNGNFTSHVKVSAASKE